MKNETVEKTIGNIIKQRLKIPTELIQSHLTLKELGANSLDQVEIILDIENEFKISIAENYPHKIYSLELKDLYIVVKMAIIKTKLLVFVECLKEKTK